MAELFSEAQTILLDEGFANAKKYVEQEVSGSNNIPKKRFQSVEPFTYSGEKPTIKPYKAMYSDNLNKIHNDIHNERSSTFKTIPYNFDYKTKTGRSPAP